MQTLKHSFLVHSHDLNSIKRPKWIGEGAEYCKNSKLIMEKAKIHLNEIIERVKINYVDDINYITIYPTNQSFWKFYGTKVLGSCHTFSIPNSYRWKQIRKLEFGMKSNVYWKLNSPGNIEVLGARYHYNITDRPFQRYDIDYEVYHLMHNNVDQPCVNEIDYEIDTCSDNLVFEESMRKLNCTWPYVKNKNHICTEEDSAIKAIQIGTNARKTSKCPNQCNYIKLFTIPHIKHPKITGKFLKFFMPYTIQVHKAYYAYDAVSLLAEIGGYVGLFLGFSIYQLTDLLNWLINFWKSYQT